MKAILCSILFVGPLLAEPALTIYNQNFAVVRDSVALDLKPGVNSVNYSGATAQVEPESVILRDASGKIALQILEQSYRNDPADQQLLLKLFEGKEIEFEQRTEMGKINIEKGKIIRGCDREETRSAGCSSARSTPT